MGQVFGRARESAGKSARKSGKCTRRAAMGKERRRVVGPFPKAAGRLFPRCGSKGGATGSIRYGGSSTAGPHILSTRPLCFAVTPGRFVCRHSAGARRAAQASALFGICQCHRARVYPEKFDYGTVEWGVYTVWAGRALWAALCSSRRLIAAEHEPTPSLRLRAGVQVCLRTDRVQNWCTIPRSKDGTFDTRQRVPVQHACRAQRVHLVASGNPPR